ncbi:pyroglutamyl-peptidase I [Chryseomicrobium palamuruense]|uniref:Pyrrolidone-carboxylate peptidase n=1 Tax=Chryseomicrobium palamuruense TaxID=682973 RepID=A0ABV8UU04_9BACL
MKKLLLTGFEPFLSFSVNPTMKIVEELNGQTVGDYTIEGRVLTVDFEKTGTQLIQLIEEVQPDALISLGLAGGRYKITPERIAINFNDVAETDKDNAGNTPIDQPIIESGPASYLTTLPARKMINRLIENGYPAEISNSAGTYLCNNTMYNGLHYMHTNKKNVPAGFIHIPASHELALEYGKVPSWSHKDLLESIKICIEVLNDEQLSS